MSSVRTRILGFFVLFAALSLLTIILSGRSVHIIGDAANGVVNQHLPMVHALAGLENALQNQEIAVYRYLLSNERVWLDDWEKERVNYARSFEDVRVRASEQLEQDKLGEVDEQFVQYDNLIRQALMTRKTDAARAFTMVKQGDQMLGRIQQLLDEIKGFRQGMSVVRQQQIADTMNRHRRVAYYFVATLVIFGVGLALYLWHFVVRPLTYLIDGIRNFTRGKTDVQIPPVGKDELGELQEAFNEMSRELQAERRRLTNESQSDALTGLFNMRYFRMQLVEEFSRSQRYGRPMTLLLLDVDHFKSYNDRNGHPAGDIVLKEVSRILIRNVRGTDIVARYGGEEFVVLLPETTIEAGLSVAEKIRAAVENHFFPFIGTDTTPKLTVSVGVASYPDAHVTSDQDLIEAADKALYMAKRNGRNRVITFGVAEHTIEEPAALPAR